MKKITLLLLLVSVLSFSQITLIPDTIFEQALIDLNIDSDGVINGQVATADIENVIDLNLANKEIADLAGIEDFTSLRFLNLRYNIYLESLDVSNNLQLEYLDCSQNSLSALDVSNNLLLEVLFCGNIDFDAFPQNSISSLDLTNNLQLKELYCPFLFDLGSLDLSNNTALTHLAAYYCGLDSINFSNNALLEVVDLGTNLGILLETPSNNMEELDFSFNPNLEILGLYNTNISSLDLRSGYNYILTQMYTQENPNLFCIEVDNAIAANNGDTPYSGWTIDPQTSYSEDCNLSISDTNLQSLIQIYPNPVKSILNIKRDNNIVIEKITIYDILGKIIAQNQNEIQLNVSHLVSGIFLVKIETNNGVIFKRVLKE